MITIAPSVLAADFAHLADEIRSAEAAGVEMLHLDIMDGHFVPNISFGPGIVSAVKGLTDRFLDVHLMISEPEKYLEPFAWAGANNITFHLEVHPDPRALAKKIRGLDCKVGISLNPDMPVEKVLPYLEHFDFLLIMSVFPGFGGQAFIPESLERIANARTFIDLHRLATRIEVDGGVDKKNARAICEAGADVLIMGTAFFGEKDRRRLMNELRESLSASQIARSKNVR